MTMTIGVAYAVQFFYLSLQLLQKHLFATISECYFIVQKMPSVVSLKAIILY